MPEDQQNSPLRLAVLISGGGTTLQNLIQRIGTNRLYASIEIVISSNSEARGIEFAAQAEIPSSIAARSEFQSDQDYSSEVFRRCRDGNVDLVVMAGFLKYLPIASDFENRVVNIHPGLIPAFCGKGMYGLRVHQAVLDYGAKVSGCTVHFVDDVYEHGPIILQRVVDVHDDDTAEMLQQRVFAAECEALPDAISLFGAGKLRVEGRRVAITQ